MKGKGGIDSDDRMNEAAEDWDVANSRAFSAQNLRVGVFQPAARSRPCSRADVLPLCSEHGESSRISCVCVCACVRAYARMYTCTYVL